MPRRDVMPRPVNNVHWRSVEIASCTRKVALSEEAARRAVVNDLKMRAYRCCFDSTHWHVGHPLKMKQLRKIATALRSRQEEGAR